MKIVKIEIVTRAEELRGRVTKENNQRHEIRIKKAMY